MKPSLDEWLRFIVGITMAITLVGIVGALSGIMVGTQGKSSDRPPEPKEPEPPLTWTGSGRAPKWVVDKETE